MSVTASGLYVKTILDVFDTTQLALDLDLETHKLAMFTDTITPSFSADTAYGVSPYNANEVSGTGYTAGGALLITTTFTEPGGTPGTVSWDADDVSWATSTITNAKFGLGYADALAGNNAIVGINFGSNFSTVAGTFLITFAAAGIFTIDLTP